MARLVHLELHTSNLAGAVGFVHGMFGWRPEHVTTPHGSYMALDMGPTGISGGIVEREVPRGLWLPYVAVDEIATATERARSLGADVVAEPTEGAAGVRSTIATPCGTELTFWQQKR